MKKLITLLSILLFGIFSISSCSNSGSSDSNEIVNNEIVNIEEKFGFDPNASFGSYLDRKPSEICKGFSKKYDDEYNQVDESKTIMSYTNPNDKSCNYLIKKYNSEGRILYQEDCSRDNGVFRQKIYSRVGVTNGQRDIVEQIYFYNIFSEEFGNIFRCTISDYTPVGFTVQGFFTSPHNKCNVSKFETNVLVFDVDSNYPPNLYYINDNKVSKEEYDNTCP